MPKSKMMDFNNTEKIAEIRSHLSEISKKLEVDTSGLSDSLLPLVSSVNNTLNHAVSLQERGHHQIGHADLIDDEAIADHIRDGGTDFLHRAHYLINVIYDDIVDQKP